MKTAGAFAMLKSKARSIKQNVFVLVFAYRDRRVPWYAKWFAVCVVAYAFSPIDLIPDFIPVLGYLDDLIIVPLGIALALKMIPEPVLADCRVQAEALRKKGKPKNWIAAALFVAVWLLLAVWAGKILYMLMN
ncbi:YkvA family protein [Paenibacillus thalictri]|uniref:DUF1232 domain-containing protein n=1 Tax=Paenibacillus thalictri TaxID=2527873 RepID=A0A4Q9DHA1_9BACL|nr:YkvA family protein [Paenibacillus thalictri]TBL70387.1 DUF1232 domain-containing protein [Paenibacillus thalictri]